MHGKQAQPEKPLLHCSEQLLSNAATKAPPSDHFPIQSDPGAGFLVQKPIAYDQNIQEAGKFALGWAGLIVSIGPSSHLYRLCTCWARLCERLFAAAGIRSEPFDKTSMPGSSWVNPLVRSSSCCTLPYIRTREFQSYQRLLRS